MVRIGSWVLFERDKDKKPKDETPELEKAGYRAISLLPQQMGEVRSDIRHINGNIEGLNNEIQFLREEIQRLKTTKAPKEKYAPTEDLKARIMEILKEGPRTSTELREQARANANKTTRAIHELVNTGKVKMKKEGRKKLFYR